MCLNCKDMLHALHMHYTCITHARVTHGDTRVTGHIFESVSGHLAGKPWVSGHFSSKFDCCLEEPKTNPLTANIHRNIVTIFWRNVVFQPPTRCSGFEMVLVDGKISCSKQRVTKPY